MATLGQDTFAGRTVASGLGNASDGQLWQILQGTVSFSVGNNEGSGTGATAITNTALGTTTPTDTDQAIRFEMSSTADGFGLVTRQSGSGTTSSRYRLSVSGTTLSLVKTVSGTSTTLGTATVAMNANTFYWLRFSVIGTTLQGKFWQDGTAEPSTWNIPALTDSALTSGLFGFYVKLNLTTDTVTFDSYKVTDGTTSPTTNSYITTITDTQLPGYDANATIAGAGTTSISDTQVPSYAADATSAGSGNTTITDTQLSTYAADATSAASSPTTNSTTTITDTQLSTYSADATIAGNGNASITDTQLPSYDANVTTLGNATTSITDTQLPTYTADATIAGAGTTSISDTQLPGYSADATSAGAGSTSISDTSLPSYDATATLQTSVATTITDTQLSTYSADVLTITTGLYVPTITDTSLSGYSADATTSVSYPISLSVSPPSLFFNGAQNGSNPATQTVTLSDIGGTTGLWTSSVTYNSGSGWLSISPSSGSLSPQGTQTIVVSPTLARLPVGAVVATISFTSGASTVTVQVTLTVTPNVISRSLTVSIGTTSVMVLEGSLKISNTLDQRSTCTFVVRDDTGTHHYQPGQTVIVADSVTGTLFTGYVESSVETNIYPQSLIYSTITCIDQHYLADKRVAQKDYFNRYAGDIANDLLHTYLAAEGVNLSNMANRSDQYQVDWSQGTLSGLVATSNVSDVQSGGNLELASSGSTASFAQQQAADFSGTANLLAYNTALQGVTFTPTQAMKLSATQGSGQIGNAYVYMKFWAGNYAIPANSTYPVLVYDIWVPDSCPQQMAGLDLVFTDGSTLRDTPTYPNNPSGVQLDAQGLPSHPNTDLSGLATNQWYHRLVPLYGLSLSPAAAGKTLSYATFVFEGDNPGNYTAYVRNVSIQYQSAGSYVAGLVLFSTTAQATASTPQQLQTAGYSNVQLSVVTAYEKQGTMLSTTFDTSAAGIYNTSLVQWQETDVPNTTIAVNFSGDGGATYLSCTNNAPLPWLVPGQNLSGVHGIFQYVMTNTGNDPTQTSVLSSVQAVVNPSYACTKSDNEQTYSTTTGWNSGTYSNLITQNTTLSLNGVTRNWDSANISNQTMFGANGPGQSVYRKDLQIRLNNPGTGANFGISRFDFAGQWADFTAEIDVNITTSTDEYGLVYRTTGWQSVNDTYAYSAWVSTTNIVLARGTNTATGAGGYTTISSVSLTLSGGSWHRLKVVATGSTHQVYLDNVLYINVTDSTYTAAGYIGARLFSTAANYNTGQFDNFGVAASLYGQWVSPAINLSSLGTISGSQLTAQLDALTNPSLCTLLVEMSLNNGSTWTTVTPGAGQSVPGLTTGTNVSAMTAVKVRVTLTSSTATTLCVLDALTLLVIGSFSSTGTRISPASSLSGISQMGSTAITWNGLIPANTSCTIDSSTDGTHWTNVGTVVHATPGNAQIAGINGQSDPTQDSFATNTSANYTQTAKNGGTSATWTWDTANTRLVGTNGVSGIILYQGILAQNADVLTVCDYADNAGLVWCFSDTSDFYELVINDSSFATGSGLYLNKVKTNTVTLLQSQTGISFRRGDPHSFEATMQIQSTGSALITVYMDGTTMFTYTDTTPLASGQMGLFCGNKAQYYQLRIQQLGDLITATNAYTRVTLTTTDPTQTPQLTTLTLSAHAPSIGRGNLITQTNQFDVNKGGTKAIAQCLDDLAKQSNYYWQIDKNKNFIFSHRAVAQAARVWTQNDMLVGSAVKVENVNTSYRNSQWVNGSINTISDSQSFVGDGKRRTFTLKYPVHSHPQILVNGAGYSVGIKGVDTGKAFYWQQGSTSIVHDTSRFPLLKTQVLVVNYVGEVPDIINQQSSSAISARAALDSTTGIVEAVESAPNLVAGGATTLANARIAEYAGPGKILTFTTNNDGLQIGQQVSIFLQQHALNGVPFLVHKIDLTYKQVTPNGVVTFLPFYTVTAVSGAMLYDWTHFFAILGQQ